MSSDETSLGRADLYGIVLTITSAAFILLLASSQFFLALPLQIFWIFMIVEGCTIILSVIMCKLQAVPLSFARSSLLWIGLTTIISVELILESLTNWKIGWDITSFVQNVIATGPVEETLFRGYLQTAIVLALGVSQFGLHSRKVKVLGQEVPVPLIASLIITNVVFASYHIPIDLAMGQLSIADFVFGRFTPGLVFSIIYALTGNLVLPMLVHGLYNYDLGFLQPTSPGVNSISLLLSGTLAVVVVFRLWKVSGTLHFGRHQGSREAL